MIRAVCVSSAIALAALITAGPGLSAPNVPGPPGPAAPQPVSQLACFAGRWQGEGWILNRQGKKEQFAQTETVEPRLGHALLTIEGVGRDKKTNDVVHHAFAVVSNAPDGSLRFSSWLVDGRHTQAQGKVLGPGSFSWELKVPHGTVRYTLTCQGDTWTEEGAFSPKPGVWRPSFGMSLTRVK